MERSQRLAELLAGCKATQAEEVTVEVAHVIQALGSVEAVEELGHSYLTHATEVIHVRTARSARTNNFREAGHLGVNRLNLIAALEKAKKTL